MLNIATRAARRAGEVISRSLDKVDSLRVSEKGANDFVSEVDYRAEQEIIHNIRKAYPDHSILAEESGHQAGNDYMWIIDPLDGTTNFLHGFPQFAVSIAVKHKDVLEHAAIYDPLRQEMYSATRGSGAMMNNRRMRVTNQAFLKGALLGTGFPFKKHQFLDTYLAMFRSLFVGATDIRRAGSAALDLAYVADGRLDGFWEIGLREWDMAAGVLLITEAGGMVSDFRNGEDVLSQGNIIAGNPKIHQLILNAITPHITPDLFEITE